VPDPSQLYWALTLNAPAITLSTAAPHDTFRLVATPRAATGEPLAVSGAIVYTSNDVTSLRVGSDGFVRAVAPGNGLHVIATLTVGNLTHADTAMVNVTSDPSPPVLKTFSIHPVSPDSAKRAGGFAFYSLPVYAVDTSGQPIPDVLTRCRSSDQTIAIIPNSPPVCAFILAFHPGHVRITATATWYGVTKADTLDLTVGRPLAATVALLTVATAPFVTDTIATGGIVGWVNQTGEPASVTFDDTTNVVEDPTCQCGAGDIPPFDDRTTRSRLFPVAGSYRYHSSTPQGSGTVVVMNDP
jgi:hypothetical protein